LFRMLPPDVGDQIDVVNGAAIAINMPFDL
jgi:hypothetical protein